MGTSSRSSRQSELYSRIYKAVRSIPEGRVSTYGRIADLAGCPRQARLVGYALHRGGDDSIPWHRVINYKGRISLDSNAMAGNIQQALLENEGVVFSKDGAVDLDRYVYPEIS
ncbi:MGMT family protein [Candidatus Neomarinimicrobiota bacterium]